MASQSTPNPTTLDLTENESKLRDLLLGVAAYIDASPSTGENDSSAQVPDELSTEKLVLRWTGGWVRDKLLGVGSHDIDVAINKMTGEQFGKKMHEYLRIPGNGEKHGLGKEEVAKIASGLHVIKVNPEASKNLETATTRVMGMDLDFVNLRKETYNEVSRNPEMEFGTAEEDALRRDATVNAMFYNLNTKEIEDFTGCGHEDMAAKIIRTPLEPYQTFKDDPLRVLRLIRFASRLNYRIEEQTAAAMANEDIQKALKIKIKRERVGVELEKMLKGPDPNMALALISKFNLYETIFTDPTRELPSKPETGYFASAYTFVNLLQNATNADGSVIAQNLLRSPEERYLGWICAAVMPWGDASKVPNSKPSRPAHHAAYLIAQEGFKAPNKVCDVLAAALNNREDIAKLVGQCHKQLRMSENQRGPIDATARDVLGMAIRRWGSTWRTQVLFSLIYECALGTISEESIMRQYADFLKQLDKHDILDADTFKPLINGKELASALKVKPGPWMKDALDVVMAWQLRNPDVTDATQAIEEVQRTSNSELPSRLIAQLLQLTIRPLFQTSANNKNDSKPWKDPKNDYFLDLLKWILHHSDEKGIRHNMDLLCPPILQMLDDPDLQWRARACQFVTQLVQSAPTDLFIARGYDKMFTEILFSQFSFLPSLTPERESVDLVRGVYPALIALCRATGRNEIILDRIVREGVLATLGHLNRPSNCPQLTTLVLNNLAILLDELHIDSVKHLAAVLDLLGPIISDPFAPSCPPMLLAALRALRSTIANGWPRFGPERSLGIYKWACTAWLNCQEYNQDGIDQIKEELKELMKRVDTLLESSEAKDMWGSEKERVFNEDSATAELIACIR